MKINLWILIFALTVILGGERAARAQTPTPTAANCSPNDLDWNNVAPMPTARDRFAMGMVNGILYAVGGQNGSSNSLNTVEAYNPGTNSWTTLASLPTGREDLAVGVVNGRLYAVGGFDGAANVLGTVEAYDPVANSWSAKASLPGVRCNLSAGVVNGILYAVGGDDAGGNPLGTVEAYNPVADSWSAKAPMPTARSQFTMAVVNGILFAAGGNISPGFTSPGTVVNTLEAYNPATNSWTTGLAPMITARECDAIGVMGGLFYVMGGAVSFGFPGIVTTVEAYDPAADSWSAKAPMPGVQSAQGAEVVNGVLYSVGGWSGGSFMGNNQAGTLVCGTPTPTFPVSSPPGSGEDFIYPSPARGDHATVAYNMAGSGHIDLKVWDEKAELAAHVTDQKPTGVQTTPFNISGFATGIYFYVLTINYDSGRSEQIKPQKFSIIH